MTNLRGKTTRLRAVEPSDLDRMYEWENDPNIWSVSGTKTPFSRHTLEKFIENQQHDISETHQQRLIIETLAGEAVGALDLYEYDIFNSRAGLGILIFRPEDRGKGYATDALEIACHYAQTTLHMHQLWCGVEVDNAPSIALFRRAGFEQTGTKRDWLRCEKGYVDEVIMQKIIASS